MKRVMLDIETLGTKPGSVVLSIGAVKFGDGKIHDEFSIILDPESCVRIGMTVDVSTVRWWMGQSDEARRVIAKSKMEFDIDEALIHFAAWLKYDDCEVWGNGSDFDNVLLARAYEMNYMSVPWKFWNNRCYRTIAATCKDIRRRQLGTHHNALDDARSQALHLMEIEAFRGVGDEFTGGMVKAVKKAVKR